MLKQLIWGNLSTSCVFYRSIIFTVEILFILLHKILIVLPVSSALSDWFISKSGRYLLDIQFLVLSCSFITYCDSWPQERATCA